MPRTLTAAKRATLDALRAELAELGEVFSPASWADTLANEPDPEAYLRQLLAIYRRCAAGGSAPHVGLDPTTGGR